MGLHVLILPGFAASNLEFATGLFKGRKVYYSPQYTALFGIDDLDLADDGISPGPLAAGPLQVGGVWEVGPYQGLIDALKAGGNTVEIWPYDWRVSLLRNGTALATYLKNNYATTDFAIVAHSTGGLVARVAYASFRAISNPARWKRSVYLAVPHGGSYLASRFLCGFIGGNSLGALVANALAALIPTQALATARGGPVFDRAKRVIASWPCIYELLPNDQGIWSAQDPHASQAWQRTNYVKDNPAVTQARLDAAHQTQGYLNDFLTQPRPPEVNVAGWSGETPDRIIGQGDLLSPRSYNYTDEGDIAVPLDRLALTGVNLLNVTSEHSAILYHSTVLVKIAELVANGLPTAKDDFFDPPGRALADKIPPSTIELPVFTSPFVVRLGDP